MIMTSKAYLTSKSNDGKNNSKTCQNQHDKGTIKE